MFGQDTMWGDSGPMDCDNVYKPESSYYEERYDYLDDSDLDYNDDFTDEGNLDCDRDIFSWQVKIDMVHNELLNNI